MLLPDRFNLDNKVAIVTGACGLLGRFHCQALADAGAKVVVCDLDQSNCSKLAADLGDGHLAAQLDITDRDSIINIRDLVLKTYGHIDVLVNNAAINDMFENPGLALQQSQFENYPLEMLRRSIDVNVTGTILCAQIFGSWMAEKGRGSIINIASTYGIVAPDQSLYRDDQEQQIFYKSAAYPTTKGAVLSFTRYLAAYWGKSGVRVNALSPGGVQNGQDEFFINKYADKTPLKRMAQPEDYMGAVVFLASDASSYMTGANLVVDGGWTIW